MLKALRPLVFCLLFPSALLAQTPELELRVREIAEGLRCVVCQNLSVADSPSELAQQMRAVIREQLKEGKSPDQINAYFVSKYGDWVLLAPPRRGFSLLVWVLPFAVAAAGMALVLILARRWVKRKQASSPSQIEPQLLERAQRELAHEGAGEVDVERDDPQALLLKERARLYEDIKELEFDYQAGKLSENDYSDLRKDIEAHAARVLKELESTPPSPERPRGKPEARAAQTDARERKRSYPRWQIAAGGIFLLLFGLALGVLLSQSVRPRLTEQDTITGGFLTGRNQGGDIQALLARGRSSFDREEWPQAIEAFKAVLGLDPNQPEAHSYMGLILARAGHPDGALLAFDRALSANPDFPLALWGKGMLLYRVKEDFTGARQILQKLVNLMPPGAEKTEVEKTLAELVTLKEKGKRPVKMAEAGPAASQSQQINGVVSVDPKLREKINNRAVLFIIVRSASTSAGPPLAVKKIDHPSFPLAYSIGSQDAMMPGVSLSGGVFISARLDQDGNPMTREPGNLEGEYRKNPVKVGAQKVDIVLDRVM